MEEDADGSCHGSLNFNIYFFSFIHLSLLLRFWVNTLKNPQFIFDVRVSDNVDANLTVIAQTFIDACTTAEHKVGRVSLHMCTWSKQGDRFEFECM